MTFGISISGAVESCSGSAWHDGGSTSFSGSLQDVAARAVAFVLSGSAAPAAAPESVSEVPA